MQVKQIATKFSALFLTVLMVISCMIPVTVSAEELTGNEAKVGATEYATLKEAVVAANGITDKDVTIEILRDLEITEMITISLNQRRTIIFEGGNHTIYLAENATARKGTAVINCESSVTFKNLTFNGQPMQPTGTEIVKCSTTNAPLNFNVVDTGKVTFDGCTITGFHVTAGYSALYVSGTNTGYSAEAPFATACGIELKDTVITGNVTDAKNKAIIITSGNETVGGTVMVLSGNTIVKENYYTENSVLKPGDIHNYGNEPYFVGKPKFLVKEDFSGEVHFNFAYVVTDNGVKYNLIQFEGTEKGYLNKDFFKNGIMVCDASSGAGYVYRRVSSGTEELISMAKEKVAYNDKTTATWTSQWGTLSEIISGATAGDTIHLWRDIDCTAQITVDKSLTIDGHGHTIKQTSANTGHMMNISTTGSVNVKNLVFHGGASDASVGTWETPLFAINKKMVNITNTSCDVKFTDCSFTKMRVEQTSESASPVVYLGNTKVTFAGKTLVTDNITRGVDASDTTKFSEANGGAVLRFNGNLSSVSFEGCPKVYDNFEVTNETNTAYKAANYYGWSAQRIFVSGPLDKDSKIMIDSASSGVVVGKDSNGVPFSGAETAFYDLNGNQFNMRLERATKDDGTAYMAYGNKVGVLYQTQGADWTDDQYAIAEKAMYASLTKDNMTVNIIAKSYASPVDTLVKIYVGGEARAEYRLYELASTIYNDEENDKEIVCSIIPVMVNMNEMAEPITVEVGDTSGDSFSLLEALDPITVKQYADAILNDTTGAYDAVKDSVKALLNLGAYSEGYFNKKPVANRVNAGIWEEGQNPVDLLTTNPLRADAVNAVTAGTLPEGVTVYGAALYLSGEISMRLRIDGTVAEGTELKVGYGNALVDCEIVTGNDGVSYIEMAHIGTAKLGDMITFKIGDYTYLCSPMTYVNAVLKGSQDADLVELCKALYLYYDTVAAGFGFTNTVK